MGEAQPEGLLACRHCGTLVEEGPYCCSGCELAAAILEDAGLEGWYEKREDFADVAARLREVPLARPRARGKTGPSLRLPSLRLLWLSRGALCRVEHVL